MMLRRILSGLAVLIVGIGTVGCGPENSAPPGSDDSVEVTATVDSLAEALLDTTRSDETREAIVNDHPDKAVALVEAMTDDLSPGTEEEYSRIPWIWRVSIALGERNNAAEIRRLLEVSLPEANEPLREWQSVVIGGGIINGISRQDGWPKQRVEDIVGDDQELMARWKRANELSSKMADNEEVDYPYRYDALRMIAMKPWSEASDQLIGYLSGDVDSQLQMGAISGLSDMRSPEVAGILIDHYDQYSTDRNRELALDALMRTPERTKSLLGAVANDEIPAEDLGDDRIRQLTSSSDAEIRKMAAELFDGA